MIICDLKMDYYLKLNTVNFYQNILH